jgi:hypothetical protein
MKKYKAIALIVFSIAIAIYMYCDKSIQSKPYWIVGIICIRGIYGLFADPKKPANRKKWVAILMIVASLTLLGREAVMYLMNMDYSHLEGYHIVLGLILFMGCFDLIHYYRSKLSD